MNSVKKFFALATIVVLGFLAGCGQREATVTESRAKVQADEAWRQGIATEAAKSDAKLFSAKQELGKIGIETARQGAFNSAANCNVVPDAVNRSTAMKNFPTSATAMYRDACVKEVVVMNGERKANNDRAVARAKAKEQKLAAKKAKQAEIAAKSARKRHATALQPARPSAVKPVAQTGQRN